MNDLDSMLSTADPARERPDAHPLVMAMSGSVATAVPTRRIQSWWRTARFAVPVAVGGVLALTAAAVIVPLSLSINGHDVEVDATVPIAYTTATGVKISCEIGIYFGDPTKRTEADQALAAFVASEDWTGIGQEIYEEAMANPFVPSPEDDWEVDTQALRDQTSFMHATHLIEDRIPAHLLKDGMSNGSSTTCTGQLR